MSEHASGMVHELELSAGTYEVEVGGGDGPFARRHLGTVEVSAGGAPVELRCEMPPARSVRLEVMDVGEHTAVELLSSQGWWEDLPFDEVVDGADGVRIGVIDAFAVPGARFGLWLPSSDPQRDREPRAVAGIETEARVLRAVRRL